MGARRAAALLAATSTITAAIAATPLAGGLAMPERAQAFLADPIGPPPDRGPFRPLRAALDVGDGLGAGRGHEGVDLFAAAGTPLVAVDDGFVLETGADGGRGNWIAIFDPRRNQTYNYFHMLGPASVSAGQRVRAGAPVGELGCTGSCYGDHLHFEVRAGRGTYGTVLDPLPLLERLRPL
jgi:murein DD-endopeptidase MepM/ murein hydrolase activator NlpD